MSPRRLLAHRAAMAIPLGLVVATAVLLTDRGALGYDTLTYLAAGERLNAGHLLYSLGFGDRPVYVLPPYWTVPLVSPPLIAVAWRPLAALPNDAGIWIWWAGNVCALAFAVLLLWRRRPLLTAVAATVLFLPTAYEVAFGNMNGFLLLATLMTWRWSLQGRHIASGTVVGAALAVKLVPSTLAWWLLATGRTRAVLVVISTVLALEILSIAGAGLDAHLEYLRILRDGSIGIYELSLGGFAVSAGVDPELARLLPPLAAIGGLVLVAVLRHRPAAAFAVAVLTMIAGSPTVNITWLVLAYGTLSPLAWPGPARMAVTAGGSPSAA